MKAVRSYYDGSKGSWIVLAGLSSPDDGWGDFEQEWNRILANRNPRASYMHMTDAKALQGDFSRDKGWDESKVNQLINDLVLFLSRQDKKAFHAFVSALDARAHAKLAALGVNIEKPELICTETCVGHTVVWAQVYCPSIGIELRTMDFFFDRGEKFQYYFEEGRRRGKKKKAEMWSLVNTIAPVDMKLTPGVQAADIFAWAARYHYTEKQPMPLWDILGRVFPMDIIVMDETRLRKEFCRIVLPSDFR